MGHVDHGKTTLLDLIRKSTVAQNEAGGITQHIGAFQVALPRDRLITFFDTPGHESFAQMRSRGVQVTDIVVLVVSAGDGVMPQTEESIKLAHENGVPIVVALNKCDRFMANVSQVKQSLFKHSVRLEEFGGDVQCVPISALTGQNVDLLIECILAQADVMDLRGAITGPVEGFIIETRTSPGLGYLASTIVRHGTLALGDILVAGNAYCRVKGMWDSQGSSLESVTPGIPVEIAGWREQPRAGEVVLQSPSERHAKRVLENRQTAQHASEPSRVLEGERGRQVVRGGKTVKEGIENGLVPQGSETDRPHSLEGNGAPPTYPVILCCDVAGSEEALVKSFQKIPQTKIRLEIARSCLGSIAPSDMELARALRAPVYFFNVPVSKCIVRRESEGQAPHFQYKVIYDLVDDLQQRMQDALPPVYQPTVISRCEVRQVFAVDFKNKRTIVAGCKVTEGLFVRVPADDKERYVRVVRRGKVIVERTSVLCLKHLKDETGSVNKGMECGIILASYKDVRIEDTIELTRLVPQKQSL